MKRVINFVSVILMVGFSLSSCSEENNKMADLAQEALENNLESGTWRVTLFEDSGNDETNHFSGYDFTFEVNGTLSANNGVNMIQGTWSITDSNSNDDSPHDLDFNIFFNASNDFEELNEDWDIISHSDMKIELVHISGGNGGTDYLTFQRN